MNEQRLHPARIVLLRGLGRHAAHWGTFPGLLRARLPGYEVVAWDLPGFGAWSDELSPATISGIVDRMSRRFGGPPMPTVFVGYSLGGMVALEWSIRAGDSCLGLVLINSSTRTGTRIWQRMRPACLPRLLAAATRSNSEASEQGILELVSNDSKKRAAMLPLWTSLRQTYPLSLRSVIRQLLAAARYRPPAIASQCPARIICSKQDRLVSWRCSERLARDSNGLLAVHESAGHDIVVDDPVWLAGQIAAFVESLDNSRDL